MSFIKKFTISDVMFTQDSESVPFTAYFTWDGDILVLDDVTTPTPHFLKSESLRDWVESLRRDEERNLKINQVSIIEKINFITLDLDDLEKYSPSIYNVKTQPYKFVKPVDMIEHLNLNESDPLFEKLNNLPEGTLVNLE